MGIELYLAPAGHGKSAYLCRQLMAAASGLAQAPLVCVPTAWQARAWRRRLARKAALGVHVVTFNELYQACLDRAGDPHAVLAGPALRALLERTVHEAAEGGHLQVYHTLRDKPGFIQQLLQLINELQVARITPDQFRQSATDARTRDLAYLYAAYCQALSHLAGRQPPLTDAAGLAERALFHLQSSSGRPRQWSLIAFDGFDVLTAIRIAFVRELGAHYRVLFTLTGPPDGQYDRSVHARFQETYERLRDEVGSGEWRAQGLTSPVPPRQPAIAHLESALFQPDSSSRPAADTVTCEAAPDRAGEVWRALRWLKERVVRDGHALAEIALVAREIEPYRPLIREAAAAAGIPIRFEGGIPLSENPAVATLLQLVRLFRPRGERDTGLALHRQEVIELWRSPYLDWSSGLGLEMDPANAAALASLAYWARIRGGLDEWERALDAAVQRIEPPRHAEDIPFGAEAASLQERWQRFIDYMRWTEGTHPLATFTRHLELLIGGEEHAEAGSLNVAVCAREHEPTAQEDVSAVRALKQVLRSMLWAAEVGGDAPLDYADFVDELQAAVDGAVYVPPHARPALTVARLFDVRGVPLQAIAVLGLAEGQFPPPLAQDVLLDDATRAALNERLPQRLPFRLRLQQDERPIFYDLVTRPRQKMLLTRPRRAEDGSEWPASAYWEEIERLLTGVHADNSRSRIDLSPLELTLVAVEEGGQIRAEGAKGEALWQAAQIFRSRYGGQKGRYDGDCSLLASAFAETYGPDYRWSPSQLQTYITCPHYFFIQRTLKLSQEDEPADDPQLYHLGNIYHRIFQTLFTPSGAGMEPDPCTAQPTSLAWEQLPQRAEIIAESVLAEAAARFRFRPPAWWPAIRERVKVDVRRSVAQFVTQQDRYEPVATEHSFETRLHLNNGAQTIVLRGIIDRIDRDTSGRFRIIDYKLGGSASYTSQAIAEGKKIQLPLYAGALQAVCALTEPPDGHYWLVGSAEASEALSDYGEGGVRGAVQTALAFAAEAVSSVRQGHFQPQPPVDGCPSYCPAAGFCWHYTPGFRG